VFEGRDDKTENLLGLSGFLTSIHRAALRFVERPARCEAVDVQLRHSDAMIERNTPACEIAPPKSQLAHFSPTF
jgi:hypothetical protein